MIDNPLQRGEGKPESGTPLAPHSIYAVYYLMRTIAPVTIVCSRDLGPTAQEIVGSSFVPTGPDGKVMLVDEEGEMYEPEFDNVCHDNPFKTIRVDRALEPGTWYLTTEAQ